MNKGPIVLLRNFSKGMYMVFFVFWGFNFIIDFIELIGLKTPRVKLPSEEKGDYGFHGDTDKPQTVHPIFNGKGKYQ